MGNERVRGMMESVAAGAEEMNASVREISEAMTKSRQTAATAVGRVEAADAAGQAPERSGAGHERHRGTDRQHHRPDQPAGAERDDRIGARRRGRARLCRGGVRGQEPRHPGQAGDRQDRGRRSEALNGISGDVVGALDRHQAGDRRASANIVTATAAAVEEQSTVTSEMSSSMQRAAAEAKAISQR